jgi:hypothetical protein
MLNPRDVKIIYRHTDLIILERTSVANAANKLFFLYPLERNFKRHVSNELINCICERILSFLVRGINCGFIKFENPQSIIMRACNANNKSSARERNQFELIKIRERPRDFDVFEMYFVGKNVAQVSY